VDYKTIIVHLDASRRCAERVALACRLARDFDAHLTGVYAATMRELPGYVRAEGDPQLTEEWRRINRERAVEAVARFREQTGREGVERVEVHADTSEPVRATALRARYGDILVVGQTDPQEDAWTLGVPADFPEQVLQAVARPLLIVPFTGRFPRTGSRVLIGWNASIAATRAVAGALPFLRRAARVTVLTVNPETSGDHGAVPGADIALYLARHGVTVEVDEGHTREVEPGAWIISRASDLGADLIVMGGYGHSQLREIVFGGVTRSVMGQMTVPVLMEH
jgi:nucleotide-binding universal stress UspA family protein